VSHAPALIRLSNPLANRLLRAGVPMGPNALLTIRGRSSGVPRPAAVAVMEMAGRRWVMGAYGDVHWVRNLRAAGEADLQIHGRTEHVTASELDPAAATAFFEDTLPRYVKAFPWLGRAFARVFFQIVGPEIRNDPERAVAAHPVFELRAG
jgi:deazaflavin-dependent oxidoreductase (nitroreductase family)